MKRCILITFFICLFALPKMGLASSLSLSPDSGTFLTENTFNVSVLLDTEGKSINALQVFLTFPPDKLQIISPSTGSSIVNVWTVPPKFNNTAGTVSLEGGIPGGMIVSKGILTTLTFRVKSVGEAFIKFASGSRVFLNDGLATDDLNQSKNSTFLLKLPPPQGPVVASPTHPNQSVWYSNGSATLDFSDGTSGMENFSYILNKDPITIPDNIGEGTRRLVSYDSLSDGVHYFHIKTFQNGIWGGVTHFAVKVDATAPAGFPVDILPAKRTASAQPVIQFATTDASSGLDHYEIKLEPVSYQAVRAYSGNVSFFVEAKSPFLPPDLALGSYDVLVKAYDKAGNFREVKERLVITTPIFKFIANEGVIVNNLFIVPWLVVWFIGFSLLLVLVFVAFKVRSWRHEAVLMHKEKKLPKDVLEKLNELKEYRKKYGLKLLSIIIFISFSLLPFDKAEAETLNIAPPIISTISENISNKDIFYVGGRTDDTRETVIVYLQNLLTGETISENTTADSEGDWFYRHDAFLSPGNYLLWTQARLGEQLSPPGPQTMLIVKKTALEFGSNRLSYEAIYLSMVVILLLGIGGLLAFIIFHAYHGRRKHKELKEELTKAEESIRIGFAVLQNDIASELVVLHKAKFVKSLSDEEKAKEARLLKDFDDISNSIGREMEYIEKIGEEIR